MNSQDKVKSKVIFWLKIVAAVAAAILSVFGVTSVSSCSSSSHFTMSADTLYMDNPNISFRDSTTVTNPF